MCVFTQHIKAFVQTKNKDRRGFNMNAIVKIKNTYNYLTDFKNNCDNEECKKFIDIRHSNK